jgi:hypothetical protein
MSIDAKIQTMSLKFKELKSCEFPVVKTMIIAELRKLASETSKLMEQNEHPTNTKRRRQIDDVLKKCEEIEKELESDVKKEIGGGGRNRQTKEMSEAELAKLAVHSVIYHEIRSSELNVRP